MCCEAPGMSMATGVLELALPAFRGGYFWCWRL